MRIKHINRKIAERGIQALLFKSPEGYFYFEGDDVELAFSTSVMVFSVEQLSMEQWMQELDSIMADHNNRSGKV